MLSDYKQLEERLIWLRWVNQGHEAPGEEDLLEEMAETWMLLDEEEQEIIKREGPKSLIAPVEAGQPHRRMITDFSGRRILEEL